MRLELWAGARSGHDRRLLRDYEDVLIEFAITDEVWVTAAQSSHADADFDRLSNL